jgi:hypothetical protein
MSRTKLMIQVKNTRIFPEDYAVMLNERYVRKRRIPTGQPVTLQFGSSRHLARVIPVRRLNPMRVSKPLADRLGLVPGSTLCLSYKGEGRTLQLGPLIGVLVSRISAENAERPFGSMTSFCKELVQACGHYGGFAYFFSPEEIPEPAETVEGWYHDGKWKKGVFPVPNVVYNRLTSRKYENRPSVQHFFKEVKSRYGSSVFNEKYLNKTEVFEALQNDSQLAAYLPESHLFKNYQMLKSMTSKYPVVFLKPVTGSLGKGIIRITRDADGYTCHSSSVNGSVKRHFPTLAKLFSAISGKMKRTRYQIQRGVQLITVGGRPVDFRALVQRDEKGEWIVTSIVGRIAGTHHFVSNLARGGTLSPVSQVQAKCDQPAGKVSLQPKLGKAALMLAQGIGSHVAGHFGELGIDLAVDTSGKVWLLEINSKPSKDDNAAAASKIRPSVRRFVKYARYLAEF